MNKNASNVLITQTNQLTMFAQKNAKRKTNYGIKTSRLVKNVQKNISGQFPTFALIDAKKMKFGIRKSKLVKNVQRNINCLYPTFALIDAKKMKFGQTEF